MEWRRFDERSTQCTDDGAFADEGVVGLCFYVAAQVFLIRAMWKIRKVYPPGWLAFLYCLLVYILIGLDYDDGLLFRYQFALYVHPGRTLPAADQNGSRTGV